MSKRFHKIFIATLVVFLLSLTGSWAIAKLSPHSTKSFPENVLSGFTESSVPKHEIQQNREYQAERFETISLKLISTDLTVKLSPDAQVHIQFHGLNPVDRKSAFNEFVHGRTLEIDTTEQESSRSKLNLNFAGDNFNWESIDDDSRKMTLLLPAHWKGQLRASTVNGDISSEGVALNEFIALTTSGNIDITDATLIALECKTVSGNLAFDGEAKTTQATSVSGNLTLNYVDFVEKIDVESVSGDIDLSVLTRQGVLIDVTTVSGDLLSDPQIPVVEIPARKSLKGKLGDGSATILGHTVSGDFHIDVEN